MGNRSSWIVLSFVALSSFSYADEVCSETVADSSTEFLLVTDTSSPDDRSDPDSNSRPSRGSDNPDRGGNGGGGSDGLDRGSNEPGSF